jgi:HAD superfamily phosphatase (TIGR01668 family)
VARNGFTHSYRHAAYAKATDIPVQVFLDQGIKGVVLDLDNTLAYWHADQELQEAATWIAWLQKAGLKVAILSNTSRSERLARIATNLRVSHVACGVIPFSLRAGDSFGAKPHPKAFLRAAKALDLAPNQLAMVGDQLFTDILGANRAGYKAAFLVAPLSAREHWSTRAKRPLEKALLKLLAKRTTP